MYTRLTRTAPMAAVLPVLMLLAACGQAQTPKAAPAAPSAAAAKATDAPPPALKGLEKHGFELVGQFDAPGGLRGYAGMVGGHQPVAAYVTADGQQVLVGTMFDAQGNDVSAAALETVVAAPMTERTWAKLDASAWVADGKADAPRVIYTFSDANCPYCHHFWEAARPWVDAGKVQLRHMMVGVIREDSPGKAAAILSAKDPSAALRQNETQYDKGGIAAVAISPEIANKLDANQRLMIELGFQGTPGILFKDEKGHLQRRSGLPQDMDVVMGPR